MIHFLLELSAAGTKAVLSPSNGNTEKTLPKSVLLKSPSKTSLKAPASPAKNNNEATGKTNGLTVKKMDSGSPPKVARSPSAKSITPPKGTKTTPTKSTLTRNNSQGDGIVAPGKNEISSEAGDRSLNGNYDAAANIEVKTDDSESKNISDISSKINTMESVSKNGMAAEQEDGKIMLDSSLNNDVNRGDSTCIKEQRISSTERNNASGDKVDVKEKIESKENVASSECKNILSSGSSNTNAKVQVEYLIAEVEKSSPNTKTCTKILEEGQLLKEMRISADMTVVAENSDANASVLSSSKESPNSNATGCSECSAETVSLQPEVSKHSLRLEMWEHLDKNDLVVFPRPCKGRIPNFKGAPAAAEKLASLEVFRNSKTIKINPDKPQEMVRLHTLEYGKRLLVPIPRLREGLFQAVIPPAEATKYQLQQASQRYGMKKWSKPISLEDKVSIDLIVLGSVLVDKKGHRIGKGEGFADLEFAMLVKMNAVNENTVIATTVHDDQVRDELPEYLFKEHDVPVDWIITPSQVIEVEKKLERPKGIIWEILSNRRILEIPILQKLREKDLSEGHECVLKEVDSDVEEKPFVQRFNRRRRFNNYSRSTGDPLRDSKMQPPVPYHPRQPRYFPTSPQQPRYYNEYNTYPSRRNDMPVTKRVYYQDEYEPKQRVNRPVTESRENHVNDRQRNRPRSMNRPRSANRSDNINRSRSMNRPLNGAQYPSNRPHSGNRVPLNNNPRTKGYYMEGVQGIRFPTFR